MKLLEANSITKNAALFFIATLKRVGWVAKGKAE